MIITLSELREYVRAILLEADRPDIRKRDVYSEVEFNTKSMKFLDRYGHELYDAGPVDLRMIKSWIDDNNVDTILVKNRKYSPRPFLNFLNASRQGIHNTEKKGLTVPVVKGTPDDDRWSITRLSKTMPTPKRTERLMAI